MRNCRYFLALSFLAVYSSSCKPDHEKLSNRILDLVISDFEKYKLTADTSYDVEIDASNEDYYLIEVFPTHNAYDIDSNCVPYNFYHTKHATYSLIDFHTKPDEDVYNELVKRNLVIVYSKKNLLGSSAMHIVEDMPVYYYFLCKEDYQKYVKIIRRFEGLLVGDYPKKVCSVYDDYIRSMKRHSK